MAKATKATKKTFLETYESNDQNVGNACEVIKINRKTYYRWLKKYPEFKQSIEEIKEKSDDELVILAKKGLKTNLNRSKQSAVEYVLNNKTNGEYSNTVKNQLTGAGGGPIIQYITELTYDKPKEEETEKKDAT